MEALNIARNSEDSGQVLNALQSYYEILGQDKKALEMYELKLEAFQRTMAPKDYLAYHLLNLDLYVTTGKADKALSIIHELSGKLDSPLDKLVPLAYLYVYAEMGDVDKAAEYLDGAEDMIKGFGQEIMMANIYYTQARMFEDEGDYTQALSAYMKFYEMNPASISIHNRIARCYRQLGKLSEAEKQIGISLEKRPYSPLANYEAALIYLELDETERAKAYLDRAVSIWKDADETHKEATEAKRLYNSI
jgi:tetratricopeptide (TPR) repeat protein